MKVIVGAEEYDLGTVEASPTISIADFSRRETDDFGVTTVVERGFARRLSVRLALPFEEADSVRQRLTDLRTAPALWVADERFAWLTVEGFYKGFEIDLGVPPLSYCTLTVEGLAETEAGPDDGSDPAPDAKASTLQLLDPMTVTDSALAASTVAEDDHPAWASGTTYAAGAHVIRAHRRYEALTAGNVGQDPATSPAAWLDLGPTNRWAMFDQALGTATTATASLAVTLNAIDAEAVALLDVVGSSVRVQASGYDQTRAVGSGAVTFLDMPLTTGPVIVTITGSGTVSAGTLLLGRLRALGITEASPTAGINDFSRKDVDEFGAVTIVQRAWAKRMSARALIRTDAVDIVANRIATVRATPSLWIGEEGLDTLTIYGFFKDFSIEVGEEVSTLSLAIEGLSEAAPAGTLPTGATIGQNLMMPDGVTVAAPSDILNSADKIPESRLVPQLRKRSEAIDTSVLIGFTNANRAVVNTRDTMLKVRDEMVVRLDRADAAIVTERTVRATATEALAQSITSLSANYSGFAALVASEALARSDGDSANASLISTVSATANANTTAITALGGSLTTLNSTVTTLISTVATGHSTNATAITNVSSRLNNVSGSGASVETILSTHASALGALDALWMVRVQTTAGGRSVVAGIGVGVSGGTSEIAFLANKIVFANPDAPDDQAAVFEVVGGEMVYKKDRVKGLLPGNLNDGAVGEAALRQLNDSVSFTSTSAWTDLVSISLTPASGKLVKGHFSCNAKKSGSGTSRIAFQVVRDDGTVLYGPVQAEIQDQGFPFTMIVTDLVAAGRGTTWTLQGINQSSGATPSASYRFAYVEELSRVHLQSADIDMGGAGGGPGGGSGGSGGGGGWSYDP